MTLADDLKKEDELHRRRFVHATRPQRPLSMEEATALHRRMQEENAVFASLALAIAAIAAGGGS